MARPPTTAATGWRRTSACRATVRPSPAWPARRSASSAPRRPRSSASWSRRRRWSSAIPAPRATAPPPSSDRRSACSQRRNVGGVLALPHIHSGKVRDIYAIGDDRLLMVASDRLSAFDVVLDEPITDKGRVLTAMSALWFAALGDVIGNHLISTDVADLPEESRSSDDDLAGRVMLCRKADMLPIECIVRGYLSG